MPTDHPEMEAMVAGYLLGALEPDEASSLEAHLKACADCREVATRLTRVVSAVPLSTNISRAPERLRSRILEAAAAGPSHTPAPPPGRPFRLTPLPHVQRRRRYVPPWAAAVLVAAIAAFALGAGVGSQIGRLGAPSTASEYSISGTGKLAGAQARVISLKQEGVIIVEFSGLPQPSPTRTYELWIITPGAAPQPAKVFTPDPDGSKVLVLSRNFNGQVILAVTTEPGPDGSPAPTEQPSLSGTVS